MTLYEYLLKHRNPNVIAKFKIKKEDIEEHIRVYEHFYATDGDVSMKDLVAYVGRPKASIYRTVRKLDKTL